jgi:predicted acylesterase/phospholipase RssA
MPPDQLLDVVLGSGAIFPLCPARTGIGHDSRSEDFQLIDGGFAHNSPLEAATEWKATHIFLIEASPTETNNVGGFFHNSRVAFNYLYGQAQSVDLRVKSTTKATLFTLRPTRLKAGLLDFDHYSISNAIEQGRDDANRKNFLDRSNRPPFLREPAQPNFQ